MNHLKHSDPIFYLHADDPRFFQAIWVNATASERQQYAFLQQLTQANISHSLQILSEQPQHTADLSYELVQNGVSANLGLAPWLASHAGVANAQLDISNASAVTWLRLTPVYWQAARDHVNVHRFYGDMMAAEDWADWQAIWQDLVPWLNELGWEFYPAENEAVVYARASNGFDLHAPSLEYAQSEILEASLPSGQDLKRWQKLLTELQMLLHAHPVNHARIQRKARPINSLWLDETELASNIPADLKLQSPLVPNTVPQLTFYSSLAEIAALLKPIAENLQNNQSATLTVLSDTFDDVPMAVAHRFTFTPPSFWQKLRTRLHQKAPEMQPFTWLPQHCCGSNPA